MRIKPAVKGKMPCKVLNNSVIQMGPDNSCVNITLHRTIRIPDDGKSYPLPPSLGVFPIYKVDDYRSTVPSKWLDHGGLFFPMLQREAMWIKFDLAGSNNSPKAIKVGIGKINAISGQKWNNKLSRWKNDYITTDQPWLDGIATGRNTIKQFVAMGLGDGYTIEAQKTGKEEFGGIQLLTFDSKKRIIRRTPPRRRYVPPYQPPQPIVHPHPAPPYPVLMSWSNVVGGSSGGYSGGGGGDYYEQQQQQHYGGSVRRRNEPRRAVKSAKKKKGYSGGGRGRGGGGYSSNRSQIVYEEEEYDDDGGGGGKELGLAAGGTMRQKVYKDAYGFNKWDQNKSCRTFIHIVNSEMFEEITGQKAIESSITRQTYITYGYPWLEIYEETRRGRTRGIGGNRNWRNIQTVDQIDHNQNVVHYYTTNNNNPSHHPVIHHHQPNPSSGGLTFGGSMSVDQNNVRDGNW